MLASSVKQLFYKPYLIVKYLVDQAVNSHFYKNKLDNDYENRQKTLQTLLKPWSLVILLVQFCI